jgi:hypothetical protein
VPITFEIHPSIGIARVGNAKSFFVGPEPGGAPPAKYRDRSGKLLRQAARFRVFRCERAASGTLRSAVAVTADEAEIEWTVHLVNAKGAAEEFPPVATKPLQPEQRLRNAKHTKREELVIDPGPRTVSRPGKRAVFDTGTFLGTPVPLGEIQCDGDGHLVVVGGFGTSNFVSPDGKPVPIDHFANNDNWYDDASDGTVTATVTMKGRGQRVEAKPATVIVAPPDYAPGLTNLVTLYDVAFQAAVERGWRRVPKKPSFSRDVAPILQRTIGYQWLLQLGRHGHGPGTGMGDFATHWGMLADPSTTSAGMRARVLGVLRDPAEPVTNNEFGLMPRLHHSEYAAFPSAVLRLTPTQYAVMKRWAAGQFVNDLTDRPAAEPLPDALDRVALEACSGGPFFPGIEVGRILADPQMYGEAFRVDEEANRPGQLTAGNAVPWQADFLACSVDAQPMLGWWPAQRPYQVLTKRDEDTTEFWHRGVTGFRGMVDQWHKLGIVVEARRDDGTTVFVESERRPLPR